MRFAATLLVLAVLAPILAACQGKLAPLSAQRGTTIVIPLEGVTFLTAAERDSVGYGGSEVDDPQRGELRYRLDGPDGFELNTLGSSRVELHTGVGQVVSLVQIPDDAPLGSHDIHVVHRRVDPATGSVVEEPGPDYHGVLQILPKQITVDLPGGGTELVEGRPTPLEFYDAANGQWTPLGTLVESAVPALEVRVDVESTASGPNSIRAVRVHVTVDDAVAELTGARDATEPSSHHDATVWMTDEGVSGGQRSHLVSAVADVRPIATLALPFQLVDPGSALLDPSQVAVSVEKAWDENGNEIGATVIGSPRVF